MRTQLGEAARFELQAERLLLEKAARDSITNFVPAS
jgi:hypothetical protein